MHHAAKPEFRLLTGGALLLALAVAGCEAGDEEVQRTDPVPAEEAGAAETAAPALDAELARLQDWVEPFHDYDHAVQAGYSEPITPCWYNSAVGGAMGYHYADVARLEDPTVRLLEPEALMYEPGPDGEMTFVGIEYIVPIEEWEGAEPPTLLGETFRTNEELGVHILHVWLGKDNPRGLFADWNPEVTCAHAAESEDRA